MAERERLAATSLVVVDITRTKFSGRRRMWSRLVCSSAEQILKKTLRSFWLIVLAVSMSSETQTKAFSA